MTSLKKLLLGEQGLVVIFAIAFAIVALTVPNFLTERNMLGLLQSVVTIGIVACTMCAVFGSSKATTAAARAVNLKIVTPAMVVAFTGGLGMLLPAFTTFYAKQPWMHAKLTLVAVVIGLHGYLKVKAKRARKGEAFTAPPVFVKPMLTLLATGIVIFVITKVPA